LKKILFNLLNPFISVGSLFVLLIALYAIAFSNLYKPDFFYIIFLYSFILLLFLFNKLFTGNINIKSKVLNLISRFNFKRKYLYITLIFFTLGSLSNYYEYLVVGWPIFLENKVTRGENLHYVHYVTNFLMYSLLLSYIGLRLKSGFYRLFLLLIFILSLSELLVWLNRGPLLILVIEIVVFELLISYKYNRLKKYTTYMLILFVSFILLFGFFGDLRVSYVMEKVFGHSINFHYGMNENIPTSLVWVYIYSTSPFENFRHIFYNQEIVHFKYGMLLIYPFVAPIFKQLFSSKVDTYPYLDDIAGLNVSSFLESAFNDFYIFGPYIYVFYMSYLFFISLKFFDRGIYGFLGYISVFNMGVWMFFVNGFAIGPFMIGFIFFIILSLIFERKKKNVNS
jgi:hypothetical protein